MPTDSERMRILGRLEAGEINAAEAEGLLREREEPAGTRRVAPGEPEEEKSEALPPEALRWKRYWLVPFFLGISGVAAGGWLMTLSFRPENSYFWLICGMFPFWAGVLVMGLAFASQKSPWVHIRVNTGQDEWPRRVAISLPIPLRVTAWGLRTFGGRIPQLNQTGVDELLLALDEGKGLDKPLYIQVDEGDGEQVQVYFG